MLNMSTAEGTDKRTIDAIVGAAAAFAEDKVGALIVKGNRIVGTGYNGMPTDWENDCEIEVNGELKTKAEVLHAETNAIAKVAQSTETSEGSTMFCTHAPCVDCAKLIYQSGIATLYFKHEYRDDAGLKFLKLSGVNVHNHVQI